MERGEKEKETIPIQLENLKTNKALGLDKINARLLKDGADADVIAPVLQKITNLSIEQQCVPNSWKSAKVRALFKSDNDKNCDNYRPISILPTASKILERAVHAQLYKFLKENVLLHPRQYGFQHSSSTVHALLKFCDNILENMDNSKVTGACYLDLKKAFDTVEHSILLKKIATHGVEEKSVGWFTSYLSNCSQRTSVGNFTSTPSYVSIGVPQGSVLGPLLFLIYINDLPDILQNTKSSLFADDTVVYTTAPSADHLSAALNEDLNNVRNWLVDNRLTLNIGKSKYRKSSIKPPGGLFNFGPSRGGA